MKKSLTVFLCLFLHSLSAQKTFVPEDKVYEETIKSALLYPVQEENQTPTNMVWPPIIDIEQPTLLKLEFDELGNQYHNYFYKIINCNTDWTISNLNPIQYLNEYNEYQISDRQNSFNTRVPYIHYKTILPRVKISGNYVVMVFRNSDEGDVIISRRFVVHENRVRITMDPKFPLNVAERNTGQQIDFAIHLDDIEIVNPLQNVKTYLRQNNNWQNVKVNLVPSFFIQGNNILEYKYYNGENVFKGVNEFRYFDIRSNRFNGHNVGKATFDEDNTEIILREDQNLNTKPYVLNSDFMDGKFFVQNYESGDSETQPDYAYVTFILNSPNVGKKVVVYGELSNWGKDNDFEMKYNTAINKYTCRVLLKQGQYNYSYAVTDGQNYNTAFFEGSHNITQNIYDLLVYFRPIGSVSDLVIGYKTLNYNAR